MYEGGLKRFFDFILSLIGIILLSPLLILLCIVIKVDSKGPILFKQKRVGRNKNYFYIYKFRTMKVETPSAMPTHLLKNSDFYITRVGRFLRKSSLDELPQLINILKGEMAVIGPRPALWNQYDLINLRNLYDVNSVRPGLTGLAQISGRDELNINEKARIDGIYRNNISILMDIKCFIFTITSVFLSRGIVEGSAKSDVEGEKE